MRGGHLGKFADLGRKRARGGGGWIDMIGAST